MLLRRFRVDASDEFLIIDEGFKEVIPSVSGAAGMVSAIFDARWRLVSCVDLDEDTQDAWGLAEPEQQAFLARQGLLAGTDPAGRGDSRVGAYLARCSTLNGEAAALGWRLLRSYPRQLKVELYPRRTVDPQTSHFSSVRWFTRSEGKLPWWPLFRCWPEHGFCPLVSDDFPHLDCRGVPRHGDPFSVCRRGLTAGEYRT